jgi:hypothetical protein
MSPDTQAVVRIRTRREAERILAEILGDGGREGEYRIDQHDDGSCVIIVLDGDTREVAGVLGA